MADIARMPHRSNRSCAGQWVKVCGTVGINRLFPVAIDRASLVIHRRCNGPHEVLTHIECRRTVRIAVNAAIGIVDVKAGVDSSRAIRDVAGFRIHSDLVDAILRNAVTWRAIPTQSTAYFIRTGTANAQIAIHARAPTIGTTARLCQQSITDAACNIDRRFCRDSAALRFIRITNHQWRDAADSRAKACDRLCIKASAYCPYNWSESIICRARINRYFDETRIGKKAGVRCSNRISTSFSISSIAIKHDLRRFTDIHCLVGRIIGKEG